MTTTGSEIYEELRGMLGAKGAPEIGPDHVCRAMIRHWCEAVEDANPLYTDDEYARTTEYGGVIAPPMMIQTWTMPRLWPGGQSVKRMKVRPPADENDVYEVVKMKLRNAGYTGVMATGTNFEFLEPLRPGDTVTVVREFHEISEEKQIGPRTGHFITMLYSYTNDKQQVVCRQTYNLFMFKVEKK